MKGRSRGAFARGAMLVLLGACSTRELTPVDAGASDASDDTTTSCPFCTDSSYVYDVVTPLPDAIPPPQVACVADAGDAGASCPLPRSICVDGQWLEYFDNGTCVDSGCTFDVAFHTCSYGCWDGGCVPFSGTAPSPP